MNKLNIAKSLSLYLCTAVIAGCTVQPHIEDWDRDRITEIPSDAINVSVCFDMSEHSRDLIYGLAKEECAIRIREVQNLVQTATLNQYISTSRTAEGQAFEGPVQRQRRIEAMIQSLQLHYIENDKWECPLATPNRILFECRYDPNAKDSRKTAAPTMDKTISPDLPPELPEDLKPQ